MAVQLNIDGDNYNQQQNFQIEGVVYVINTYWNPRAGVNGNGGWYLNIYDTDENLLTTWKAMPNRVLQDFFNGILSCVDTDPNTNDNVVRIDNFGQDKRFQLVFFSAEEVIEFTG